MIIGLTGSFGAGKDTIADYLKSKGFVYHSLSDILRDELRKRNKEVTRENLIKIGNEIRSTVGAGELASRTLEIIKGNNETKSLVVSVRNPEEVNTLRKDVDFKLWFVDAPARLRYDRTAKRRRSDDFQSFDDFLQKEKMENSDDPNSQQLNEVAKMADVTIINDSTFQELYSRVDKLINNESQDQKN